MFHKKFADNRLRPLNFRRMWFNFVLSWHRVSKIRCIPDTCLCEGAKIKQRTRSIKQLCEIGEEAISEPRFTCFFNFATLEKIPNYRPRVCIPFNKRSYIISYNLYILDFLFVLNLRNYPKTIDICQLKWDDAIRPCVIGGSFKINYFSQFT